MSAIEPATWPAASCNKTGNANIGVMIKGEPGISAATEGDSIDTAPHWVPGESRRIVYQSAGVGRNREGHFLAFGPFGIHLVNIDSAEMETLGRTSSRFSRAANVNRRDVVLHPPPYNEHARVKPMARTQGYSALAVPVAVSHSWGS